MKVYLVSYIGEYGVRACEDGKITYWEEMVQAVCDSEAAAYQWAAHEAPDELTEYIIENNLEAGETFAGLTGEHDIFVKPQIVLEKEEEEE